LVRANIEVNRGSAQHSLSPLGDMLGALDIAANRLGADFTPHGALHATAIPPATEVAGFLAEDL
jgi:hypothetical protein